MVMHIDPLNPTGLNEMSAGETREHPTNHALVAGAHCTLAPPGEYD